MKIMLAASCLALLALGGCTDWQGLRASERSQYLGKPVDRMYGEWGAPINSAPLSGGGMFYEFVSHRNGGYKCEASAWTDTKGNVTDLTIGGMNGCAAPF